MANNLRHQHDDMHIAATVTFVRIYDTLTKSAYCREKLLCAQNMSILELYFIQNVNVILQSLVNVNTSINYA